MSSSLTDPRALFLTLISYLSTRGGTSFSWRQFSLKCAFLLSIIPFLEFFCRNTNWLWKKSHIAMFSWCIREQGYPPSWDIKTMVPSMMKRAKQQAKQSWLRDWPGWEEEAKQRHVLPHESLLQWEPAWQENPGKLNVHEELLYKHGV